MADQRRADETRQILRGWDVSAAEYATQFVDGLLTAARQWASATSICSRAPRDWTRAGGWTACCSPSAVPPRREIGRHRAAEGPGRTADLPQRRAAGRPHPRRRAGRRDAGQHLPDAARRTGRGAVVRGGRTLPVPRRPGLPAEVAASLGRLLVETSAPSWSAGRRAGARRPPSTPACGKSSRLRRAEVPRVARRPDRSARGRRGPVASERGRGFTFATGLRSLMRQDPEVILVGEIRDRLTAETAFQASLTGHLLLTTFHAGSAAGADQPAGRHGHRAVPAAERDPGHPQPAAGAAAVRLCPGRRRSGPGVGAAGPAVSAARRLRACPAPGTAAGWCWPKCCRPMPSDLGRAILDRSDAGHLEHLAVEAGMVTRWQRALAAVEAGMTSPPKSAACWASRLTRRGGRCRMGALAKRAQTYRIQFSRAEFLPSWRDHGPRKLNSVRLSLHMDKERSLVPIIAHRRLGHHVGPTGRPERRQNQVSVTLSQGFWW